MGLQISIFFDRYEDIQDGCRLLGIDIKKWKGYYFNAGVMAVRSCHKNVFEGPKEQFNSTYREQTYFNAKIIELGIPSMDIGWRYNCLHSIFDWPGVDKSQAYIIHFAGIHPIRQRLKFILDFIFNEWKDIRGPEDG